MQYTEKEILEKRDLVKTTFLAESRCKTDLSDFRSHHIRMLIDLYDQIFFHTYFDYHGAKWETGIGNRMTRAAANIRYEIKFKDDFYFKIKISWPLIINNNHPFPQYTSGVTVNDKLESLLIALEHELIHAYHIMENGDTDHGLVFCIFAKEIFGHTNTYHSFNNNQNRKTKEDFSKNDKVAFNYENKTYQGVIKRLNKYTAVVHDFNDIRRWRVSYDLLKK